MDAYPEDYVNHNLPLVLLSGLEASTETPSEAGAEYPLLVEKGPKVFSDFPLLSGAVAENLRTVLLEEDASQKSWKPVSGSNGPASPSYVGVKVKNVGRSYQLPPRKANPPQSSPPAISHFPDGLLTPLWVMKHQELVPAAVINFFPSSLDPNMNSLRDNQLKIEINSLKKEWAESGFRTRFVVVLISEEGDGGYEGEIDDRIGGIRRSTNLDQKSIFIIPPDATLSELKEFATSLFSLLQPSVVEYYRDLSKHARRKRNRGTIPPPTAPPTTGTSQTLSFQGWNVRYEFKLGIFAEFRQEMDAACRNYESAYGTLFGQEVFENIAGWNQRFDEARLLGDALAIRIIRCLLWTNQTTSATRFWVDHRIRTKDILDRRGKGSKSYGWEAWEARWSLIMAQLIRRAEISLISGPQGLESSTIFIHPEKSIPPTEIVSPWEHLHHEGYWYNRSARHTKARRALAHQIPAEDRLPPGSSPASQVADGFDHSRLIIDTLRASMEEFEKRHQIRKVESLSLEIAQEYMRTGSWSQAYDVLRPRWSGLTWRKSGWWPLMESFGWALRECAQEVQDCETVLRVDWELLSNVFVPRPQWGYDIHKSLEELPAEKPKPSVVLGGGDVVTPLTASLIFEKSEGNVGEPLKAQFIISSLAQKHSAPLKLSEVKLVFEGCLRPGKLYSDHDQQSDVTSKSCISSVSLREPSTPGDSSIQSPTSALSPLIGVADLTIAPSQTKIFNLTCIPREAGEAQVASMAFLVEEEKFDLTYVITDNAYAQSHWWQQTKKGPTRRRVGKDRDTRRCKIMPKPPKIRLSVPNLKETYYTNERVALTISIHNAEDGTADVTTELRLFGSSESTTSLNWLDSEESSEPADASADSLSDGLSSHCLKRTVGLMECSSDKELVVILENTQDAVKYTLEISTVYHLISDIQTPISKTITNFFDVKDELVLDASPSTAGGLIQRWCLNSKLVSFALEPIVINKISLKLLDLDGGAVCQIEPEALVSPEVPRIAPEELRESNFFLDLQKLKLGDRRQSTLDLVLEIAWRRVSESPSSEHDETLTTLGVPRLVVPMGEPRVLASATPSANLPGMIQLDYTLENPSTHFLTFNLMMEASEHFAFSGPKTTVVQLVPLSRHTVRYNLLAARRGLWIQPQLVIVDTYFNKTLRALPTGDLRADKKGILVWVDADD
ncbi:hypothetical protein N7470_007402 [Penicillium chermesinum]|nr:hypothetical protein N7470_007402 [Penicillium chermesinum]